MTTASPTRTVLRQLIDERGYRHEFLARLAGVTRSHFARILSGERPATRALVDTISDHINVPAEIFFDGAALRMAPSPMDAAVASDGEVPDEERPMAQP